MCKFLRYKYCGTYLFFRRWNSIAIYSITNNTTLGEFPSLISPITHHASFYIPMARSRRARMETIAKERSLSRAPADSDEAETVYCLLLSPTGTEKYAAIVFQPRKNKYVLQGIHMYWNVLYSNIPCIFFLPHYIFWHHCCLLSPVARPRQVLFLVDDGTARTLCGTYDTR